MVITTTVTPPKDFNNIVNTLYTGLDINKVIFGNNETIITRIYPPAKIKLKDIAGAGGFIPHEKTVVINADQLLYDNPFVKRGIRWTAATLMLMVFVLAHEGVHALQLEEEPKLKNLSELPAPYEEEADLAGTAAAAKFIADYKLPTIAEMGYLGKKIMGFYQSHTSELGELIRLELALDGTQAAAELNVIAALTNEIRPDEIQRLRSHIDEGLIGVKVNGGYYLTAYESIKCN